MNTYLGIDGYLMERALALSGLATMGEAQEERLRLLARMEEQEHARALRDTRPWVGGRNTRRRNEDGGDDRP
jgi:hypothetical protein